MISYSVKIELLSEAAVYSINKVPTSPTSLLILLHMPKYIYNLFSIGFHNISCSRIAMIKLK